MTPVAPGPASESLVAARHVRSHASGLGDPTSERGFGAGATPTPYTEISRSWGAPPTIPEENKLTLALTNVGAVTLDGLRAGLDLSEDVALDVTATSSGIVTIAGVGQVVVEAGQHTYVLKAAALR